jgi:hypothetical protein
VIRDSPQYRQVRRPVSLLTQSMSDPNLDAKLLASRAFLKASYEVREGQTRNIYRGMASHALKFQTRPGSNDKQINLGMVEADFKKELEEAKTWYAELREHELSWIRDGKDPEAEFDRLYDIEPEVSGMDVQDPFTPEQRFRYMIKLGMGFGLIAILVTAMIVGTVLIIRKKRNRTGSAFESEDKG